MRSSSGDDTHTTLGRSFRTPAHPAVLTALGRAVYCFLSLEETVTAILYDAGAADPSGTRGKMAKAKQDALEQLAERYRMSTGGGDVAATLQAAVAAFSDIRATVRNQLLHSHPFSAGTDADGNYLPGLGYTARDGKTWTTVARTPEDLLDLATAIETALGPLIDAREAVRRLPLGALSP